MSIFKDTEEFLLETVIEAGSNEEIFRYFQLCRFYNYYFLTVARLLAAGLDESNPIVSLCLDKIFKTSREIYEMKRSDMINIQTYEQIDGQLSVEYMILEARNNIKIKNDRLAHLERDLTSLAHDYENSSNPRAKEAIMKIYKELNLEYSSILEYISQHSEPD